MYGTCECRGTELACPWVGSLLLLGYHSPNLVYRLIPVQTVVLSKSLMFYVSDPLYAGTLIKNRRQFLKYNVILCICYIKHLVSWYLRPALITANDLSVGHEPACIKSNTLVYRKIQVYPVTEVGDWDSRPLTPLSLHMHTPCVLTNIGEKRIFEVSLCCPHFTL